MRGSSRFRARLFISVAAALVTTGCVVGPDYKRPEVAQPNEFRNQIEPASAESFADLSWWDVYQDPQLKALIAEGLSHNLDVAIAASRIEQARALVGVAHSEALPQIGYDADGGVQKTLIQERDSIGTTKFVGAHGGLNALWELDVWGRIKRSTEAAKANLFKQEEIRRGVLLSLVSDIADGYFRLIMLDRQLAIAEESNATYKKTLDLFTARFEAGRDARLAVDRTQGAYQSSAARIADIKEEINKQENAISILLGDYPRRIERGMALESQNLPTMPVGLTTDLLRRRPDIRAAEQEMVRANAEVGVAVANFYPRIGLSALFGGIWVNAEHGIQGTFGIWNLGASLAGPIFTGGRLESIYEQRKAYWDESIASYRKTILGAFRETADALTAEQNLVNRRAALESQVRALRNAVDLALLRYDAGRASYFEVLEAQQQLFPAEAELAQVRQEQLTAVVDLYKALGGGWKLTDDQWTKPS
jgi:outer membrane protein, multidrug efflux system